MAIDSIRGRIEQEFEGDEEQHKIGDVDSEELFA